MIWGTVVEIDTQTEAIGDWTHNDSAGYIIYSLCFVFLRYSKQDKRKLCYHVAYLCILIDQYENYYIDCDISRNARRY